MRRTGCSAVWLGTLAGGWLAAACGGDDTNGPGPDGAWFTVDDAVLHYLARAPFARGLAVRSVNYGDPGPDDEWFILDDVPLEYLQSAHVEGGSRTSETSYGDPGDDGLWFTADDPPHVETQYDPAL